MKKRIVALLLCCVMLLTLSPNLIATAVADDDAVPTVEETTEPQPETKDEEEVKEQVEEPTPAEESKTEEEKTEESKTEESKTEESKTEESKTEEEKTEEPETETEPETEVEETVESEIVYPTVNYTDVAPFLPPVSGSPMLRAARAAANDTTGDTGEKDNGMKISKTAVANTDGTYTITLEAYATGSKVISQEKKDVPTDIILVLDQSGSMAEDIGTVSFTAYTGNNARNGNLYDNRHNGGKNNLWHKLSDGSYVSVSVTRDEDYVYTSISNGKNNSTRSGATNYWDNRDNLYALVDGEYQKVTVERTSKNGTYTYRLPNKTQIASSQGQTGSPVFSNIDGDVLYLRSTESTYTYTYTDKDGNGQTIVTSTGASTRPGYEFYRRSVSTSGGGKKLDALKTAVNSFVSAVSEKAKGADGELGTADDINHRIAVVGFAMGSEGYSSWGESIPAYENTEVFIGATGYTYPDANSDVYSNAFQNMNETAGKASIDASIGALAANGATQVDLGMNMAQRILNANPVPTEETRNRVVIVFTDGAPTTSNGFNKSVASSAINTSSSIKGAGATVYSVGIFSGADATSAGTEPSGNLDNGSTAIPAASNWFMQNVSSNNGTPQTPSYYLSADNADSLNSIFQQISSQIETGGSSSTLTADAVVKDIISPQFTLPKDATVTDITLETYKYVGPNTSSENAWQENTNNAMGARASINGDQVNVTGFNFSENYVGTVTENGNTTYRGNKLVISFKVQPKAGFLGGNDVYTNTSAGIYENGSAKEPLLTFDDRPTVNVPIKDVTVTAKDKNVYLLGEVTADQLKDGAEISVGSVGSVDKVTLDLTKENYGLESWQTEYVDITVEVEVKDKDGKVVSGNLKNLTEDATYTIEVTVAPKDKGTSTVEKGDAATAKTGKNTSPANIYVFKPELKFKDSTAYYGETVPENNVYSANKTAEAWKHSTTDSTTDSTDVTMLGTKPDLKITYTPDKKKLDGNKYTKQDVPVKATVKIGTDDVTDDVTEHTTFLHDTCSVEKCGWTDPATTPNGDPAFLIHIKTCTLEIKKDGGAANEPYVFNVFKDGVKYSEVTVWGNGTETLVELPFGTYTIEEDTGWSWRYTPDAGNDVTLNKDYPSGNFTCTNSKTNDYWLNGFSEVVKNVFGVKH